MIFKSAHVRGVKADIAAGNITITIAIPLDDIEKAEELAKYAGKDASDMKVDITPYQPALFTEPKG
jgi:hypothetical protein